MVGGGEKEACLPVGGEVQVKFDLLTVCLCIMCVEHVYTIVLYT